MWVCNQDSVFDENNNWIADFDERGIFFREYYFSLQDLDKIANLYRDWLAERSRSTASL